MRASSDGDSAAVITYWLYLDTARWTTFSPDGVAALPEP
jgi:hypothetical protein